MNADLDEWPNDDYQEFQGILTSFTVCFFENRDNEEDPKVLAEKCEADYSGRCLKESNGDYKDLTKYMSERTKNVPLKDGFAVQIDDEFIDDPFTDLIGQIWAKYEVSFNLITFFRQN